MPDNEPGWLGPIPPIRSEVHLDGRVMRCFTDRPQSVHSLLTQAVARNPDGEAVVCGSERLSYRALDTAVARCAAGLERRGLGRGDRVALLLCNGSAFPVVLLAALRLGAIVVPISVREQTPGLAYMLEHCGARLLVHDADLTDRLPEPATTPALAHRIPVTPGAPCTELALLSESTGAAVAEPVAVREEDTAVILYTSGTTARPKGAMLSHLGVCHSVLHFQHCMALGPGERSIVAVPMSHVTGLVALIATIVGVAGTMIVMPAFKAGDFLRLAERERMTHTILVPAMYNLCLLEPGFAAADLSSWRVGAFGGAPMPPATIERFAAKLPRLCLINAYGATETTSPATMMPPTETARRPESVGRPLPCAEILVMDDTGREVTPGEVGEIWIRGPMVVGGYWENAAATAESFIAGFWRSGDLGSMDADGYVRVLDRKKDMINRGGYKIYSVEVENALMTHPAVVEAAVVPKPCPILGERAHAFVTVNGDGAGLSIDAEALTRHCAGLLADYKVPDGFTIATAPLPRNANGKLIKRQLREALVQSMRQLPAS